MKKHLTIIILLFIFLIPKNIIAQEQRKEFTPKPQEFFNEMQQFFENEAGETMKKKEIKAFFENFRLYWFSDQFSDIQKETIYKTSNKMLKKKMKPYPHFKNYLTTMISFVSTMQSDNSFDAWQKTIEYLMNLQTSTKFIEFLNISNSIFTENKLYESNSVVWKTDNANYTFEFDSIPIIKYQNINLTCLAKKDSSIIKNTSGTYYPTLYKWIGYGGEISWERAGFPSDSVYAIIGNYEINVKFSNFDIDSVKFFHKYYFDHPLIGHLSEKIMADIKKTEDATYPRFSSYQKRFVIHNLFDSIDYDGGFTLHGSQFIGSGSEEENAYIIFKSKYVNLIANSKSYVIKKDRISAANAGIVIYYEKDSIMHTGVELLYLNNDRSLKLLRPKNGNPFFDSYHNIDIYVEAIYWKLNEPKITLSRIRGPNPESEAIFESSNYFNITRFEKVQALNTINPLFKIKEFCKEQQTNIFPLDAYVYYIKGERSDVKNLLLNLANQGFLYYDSKNDKVIVKDKLIFYVNAKLGKTDYDVIKFISKTDKREQENAELNLLNFDLTIYGVKKIALSDSQNITVHPKDERIIVKKNRDFLFAGNINTTYLNFIGDEFYFDYNEFKIKFIKNAAMGIRASTGQRNEIGEEKLRRVNSIIEGIKGDLQIDYPNNKSGLKSLKQYPILNSTQDAYVYYDAPSIYNGVYTRHNFYFHLDPFTQDSIEKIDFKKLKYSGTFVSANIFPDIKYYLSIQKDYSLGFIKQTPPEGYDVYSGKGKYFNDIKLSNEGLIGSGKLNYITSTSESDKLIFFPDSMNSEIKNFTITEKSGDPEYPNVTGEKIYEHWEPYKNIMFIQTIDNPLVIYDKKSFLTGEMQLTPKYLHGNGTISIQTAELKSQLYKFYSKNFTTDTCDFTLKNDEFQQLGFKTTNFSANIDYKERKGDFKSNAEASIVNFPLNQYMCYMSEFTWYMDKEELELSKDKDKIVNTDNMSTKEIADLDISGSEFISTKKGQDSLRFFSARATYKLSESIIYCRDVNYIPVADALIFPDKKNVTILRDAEIKTLEKAKILANSTTKYHEIYNSIVNIKGRKKYIANGDYEYKSKNMKTQTIHFNIVDVDSTLQTYAKSEIDENSDFKLSNFYDFYGKINLFANQKFLVFKGNGRIKETCPNIASSWFKFESSIDPNNIYIKIDSITKNLNNQNIFNGFMLAKADSTYIYPTFLSEKKNTKKGKEDLNILTAYGFLNYNELTHEYRISSYDRLVQNTGKDNYVSFNIDQCSMLGDGELNFLENLGEFNFKNYGRINHYSDNDSTTIELFMLIDFPFDNDALEIISEKLEKNTDLQPIDPSNEQFASNIKKILPKNTAENIISQLTLYGKLKKIPDEMKHTFVISNVKMQWNNNTGSFISTSKIGLVNMQKKQLYKYVNGYIELKKKKGGDQFTIYLAPNDEKEWYIFQYRNNEMRCFSSNRDFNAIIEKLPAKNRTYKAKSAGSAPYIFKIASERLKKDFLKSINQ